MPSRRRNPNQEQQAKPRRKRRKSSGSQTAVGAFVSANGSFILTRVLPVLVIVFGVAGVILYFGLRHKNAKQSEKLAQKLWDDAHGATSNLSSKPYVRGKLAIVETQSTANIDFQDANKPQHWLNDHIKPPLNEPASIGSIILVEWSVATEAVRNGSGQAMHLEGDDSGDSVMLKKWSCRVKLIDLKRRLVVYEAQLNAPDRTFNEHDRVLTTPSTSVSQERLAVEFEKIRGFQHIGLDDEPPAGQASPDNMGQTPAPSWGTWYAMPNGTCRIVLPQGSTASNVELPERSSIVGAARFKATIAVAGIASRVSLFVTETEYDRAVARTWSVDQMLSSEWEQESRLIQANDFQKSRPLTQIPSVTLNEYVGVTEQNQQFISRVIAANDRSRGYRITAVWTQSGALNDKQLREIFDSFQLVPLRSKKR